MKKREKTLTRRCEQLLGPILHAPVWLWLTCILLGGGALTVLCWYLEPVLSRDGELYVRLAQIWHDTGDYQNVLAARGDGGPPPLPLYLIKCLMSLGFSGESAGILLNVVLGAFPPLFAYGIAYEITQKKEIAVLSALLMAVNPSMKALAIEAQRDMIYLFFAGGGLWLLAAGVRRQKWEYWLGAGLAFGCGILTRFEAVELLFIVLLILVCLQVQKYQPWKRSLCCGCSLFLGCFGAIFFLSLLMHTQDSLDLTYRQFYLKKITSVKNQFQPGAMEQKR